MAGVELSMKESTCALYRWMISGVLKKRRLLRSCCNLHPASVAMLRAAECMTNFESKSTPNSLNSLALCKRRCSRWNDSLLGSNNTWLAFPHKWSSRCAPFSSISARNVCDI